MAEELHPPEENTSTAANALPLGNSFLKLVAIAAGIVSVGALTVGGVHYVRSLEPALYPVRGVVMLDGKPMTGGAVISTFLDSLEWSGGLAAINDDGSFEMTTNGAQGAYEGDHAITFTLMNTGFPPQSLLPAKYLDPNNPPFLIQVKEGMEPLTFELSGKLEKKGTMPRKSSDPDRESPEISLEPKQG